jgi:hypothetical protein
MLHTQPYSHKCSFQKDKQANSGNFWKKKCRFKHWGVTVALYRVKGNELSCKRAIYCKHTQREVKLILKSEIKYLGRVKCCSPCKIKSHWDRMLAEHSDYRTAINPQILHVVLIYLSSTRSSPDTSSAANFGYNPDKKGVPCYTSEYRPTAFVAIIRVP